MNKSVWLFILLLAVLMVFPVFSQNEEYFTPYVSQLQAEIRNNLIRLTWEDSPDIKGPVFIYKSDKPFSEPLSLPNPVEIPYGTRSYLDEAENPGELYFFAAASDERQRKYTLFLPFTNTVSVKVAPENLGLSPGFDSRGSVTASTSTAIPLAAHLASPPLVLSPIYNITAQLVENNHVLIRFSGADSSRNLLLYRSIHPIQSPEDLLNALILQQKASSPFVDQPLPGISYYYAVVYEEELSRGIFSIRQGANVTCAVEVPGSARTFMREMPLPGLGASPVPNPAYLSAEAADMESSILQRTGRNESNLAMYIFPEDLTRAKTGEEHQLRTIVQGSFYLKEWKTAQDELKGFLGIPRQSSLRAKASFYLGQAYYFQDKHREALMSFLDAQDLYSAETKAWIQATLRRLAGR